MAFGNGILKLCVIAALSVAVNAEACSTCADQGTIETRETCKPCKGSGKVFPAKKTCPGCSGGGAQLDRNGYIYRGNQGARNCKACRGTGSIQPDKVNCGECRGQGVFVTKIQCPTCKGATASRNSGGQIQQARTVAPAIPAASAAPATSTVQVESCTFCGPDGKVTRAVEIGCKLCEKGFSHKKETADGKDVYKCRKCGKVCEDRYAPCPCKKPDCPDCGKIEKLTETVTCPACGGDGLITPMERAKLNQAAQAAEAAK